MITTDNICQASDIKIAFLDIEPELIDPNPVAEFEPELLVTNNNNDVELRQRGIVKRGPKSKKQGWNRSTKEVLIEKRGIWKTKLGVLWKTKLGDEDPRGGVLWGNRYDNVESNPVPLYTDFPRMGPEHAIYCCQDIKTCPGKFQTVCGYYLKCSRCNKE